MRCLMFVLLLCLSVFNSSAHNRDTIKIEVSNDPCLGVSLEEAFRKIERLRNKSKNDNIAHILIHGGEYIFDKTIFLEGNKYDNIFITPYKNEMVVFTGGVRVDKNILEVKELNNNQIYSINISKTELDTLADIRSVGFLRPFGTSCNEIFVNGEPMHLSRWPNDSTINVGKIISKGSLPYKNDKLDRGGIFTYDNKVIDSWNNTDDIWVSGYFCHGYADDLLLVKNIDKKNKTIETKHPHYWGFETGKPWNKYYFVNVLDELDIDYEYVINKKNNIIYFKYDDEIKDIVISKLDKPFFDIYQVDNICFENIIFEYSRFLAISMAESNDIVIKNCIFRNMGSAAISIGMGIEPFDELIEEGVGVLSRGKIGSLQQHIYAQSEVNRHAGHNNKIVGCQFYNLGSGAISLGGGDRITLKEGNNIVEKCKIYSTNRVEKTYRPAIHITGVGNKVLDCEIYDLPSMAILMHGNNHLIENNYIHDVCYEVDDNGAIYYGRNPTECGNVIRSNYFANIGNDYSCCSVYIDDCTGGLLVENNIFFKAGRYAVLLGGGSDNRIMNNIIIDTHIGIHVDNRLDNWANHLLDKGGLFEKRLNAVNAFGETYVKAYPYILNYKNRKTNNPERNIFWGNKLIDVDILCDNPQWIDILQLY